MRAGCPGMLPRCRAEVGHWPPLASTRRRRWMHEVDDHSRSDSTRSRGTGRVHGGAAQSARRAGTVNAAEVVTVHTSSGGTETCLLETPSPFPYVKERFSESSDRAALAKRPVWSASPGCALLIREQAACTGFLREIDRNKISEWVGVQLQESALPPRLKVGEAVRLFASFYSNPLDPDVLLESLGIKQFENPAFKSLSGGQKQRLSIALALVGNPKLAILDELTTGLDPEARRETWSLMEHLRDRGVTVILVTHFMDEAEKLCDRLALINHGTVRALDTPEALAAKAGGSRVRFAPSQPVDDQTLRAIPGVHDIERKQRYVTVTGAGDLAPAVINALAAIGVRVADVEA